MWPNPGVRERSSEIPRQNYILYNKRSITFRLIEEYFRREQMVLNTVIEVGNMEATKELVKLGIGLSIPRAVGRAKGNRRRPRLWRCRSAGANYSATGAFFTGEANG